MSCTSSSVKERLKDHVYYLASDDLHGRETGTKYEKMAAAYVRNEFENMGLQPMGVNGSFFQDFNFLSGKSLGENNELNIDGVRLEIGIDYVPLSFSHQGSFEGKVADMGTAFTDDRLGFTIDTIVDIEQSLVFLIEIINTESEKSIKNWRKYQDLRELVILAENQGAKAVVFYSYDSSLVDVEDNYDKKIIPVKIPVVFVTNCSMVKAKSIQKIKMKVDHHEKHLTGRNVIGGIHNGAEKTIVIASHHDGLGHDFLGSDSEETKRIFNGADDAASGLAVMMEFARWVQQQERADNNYLFVSFSGEELGLLGSMYFVQHPTIDLNNVNYMLSMDHVGRLDPDDNTFILFGAGTSPDWRDIIGKLIIRGDSLITYDSGLGLTDYTPFYINRIPVLGFNTRLHDDFHQHTDVADKINFEGLMKMYDILTHIDLLMKQHQKLPFRSTESIDPHEVLDFITGYTDYSFEIYP